MDDLLSFCLEPRVGLRVNGLNEIVDLQCFRRVGHFLPAVGARQAICFTSASLFPLKDAELTIDMAAVK